MGKGQFQGTSLNSSMGKKNKAKLSLSPGAVFCVSNLKTKVRIKKRGHENSPRFFWVSFLLLF